MSKKNKKILFGVLGLVVAVVVLALLYINFRPQPKDAGGSKTITLTVYSQTKAPRNTLSRPMRTFFAVLLSRRTSSQETNRLGLIRQDCCRCTADDSANQYWALYIGDDYPRQALIQHRSTMVTPLSS